MQATSTETKQLEGETVVAILPIVKEDNRENELSQSISTVELKAEAIVIANDDDYKEASEFGREIKRAAADVTAFFKPMKEAANKAHKQVCDREKVMLGPLQRAESTLKRAMGDYALQKERERQAAEAEARRIAQEEADRKLAEAIKAEQEGDAQTAATALMEADFADRMSNTITVAVEQPKAEGISTSKDWEIVSIDERNVPVELVGVMLRPIDAKAVIRLIRSSKGSVQIPGVVYKEVVKTSIRK